MKPKKIVLFGLFGQQNLGNDCSLQAMIYHVRKYLPDAEVKCICTGPEDTSARYNIPSYPIRMISGKTPQRQNNRLMRLLQKVLFRIPMELLSWINAIKTLKGTHMVIAPGTGLLTDYATGPFGRPYDLFKWSLMAKLSGCKLLFVSVGAGPIFEQLSRRFIKLVLSLADYRCYRDTFSKQYIERMGFETNNDPVYPDLAFSLPGFLMPECDNGGKQRPVVGVGVMDYYGRRGISQGSETIYLDYINKTSAFMTWLLERKYTVRILTGDGLYDIRPRQDLRKIIESRGFNYADGQIIDEEPLSVDQLLSQLAATDVVISPRFHNIILALMLSKPVISLSYNEKFESLMAELGLRKYCHPLDDLDVQRLIENFMELEKNAEELSPYIKQKTEEYRRALEKQYNFIFKNV